MFKYIIILIGFFFAQQILATSNSTFYTTPYATINSFFYSSLVDLIHETRPDYVLSENVYTWNITEVLEIINSPDLLSKSVLLQFPISVLKQLPDEILISNDLCCLLETNNTNYCDTNCTSLSIEQQCKPPVLLATERFSFSEDGQCGINCKYSAVLWGYTDEQQQSIYTIKLIASGLSIFMLIIMIINQSMDHRERKEYFCDRPLIYQCVVFITGFYLLLILQFIGIEIASVDNVLCQSDIVSRTIAFGAIKGGWMPCSILGIIFYCSILLLAWYTALFSAALWRQFYAPLKSMYADLCHINIDCINQICFCNADMESDNFSQYSTSLSSDQETSVKSSSSTSKKKKNRKFTENSTGENSRSNNNNNNNGSISINTSSSYRETWRKYKKFKKDEWKMSLFGQTYYGGAVVSCLCSKTLKFHLMIWAFAIIFGIAAISENLIDAFHPIGICFTGGKDQTKQFWFNLFPIILSAFWIFCFLPSAILLIVRSASSTSSVGQKKTMQNLGCRLGCFFFGMVFSWSFIFTLASTFYVVKTDLFKGVETRLECSLGSSCKDKGYVLDPIIFYLLFLGCFIGILSALIMSCSQKHIQRWTVLCPCLITISGGIIQQDGTIQLKALTKYLNDGSSNGNNSAANNNQTRSPRGSTMNSSNNKNSSDGKDTKPQHEADNAPEATVTGTQHDHEMSMPKDVQQVELIIGPSTTNLSPR